MHVFLIQFSLTECVGVTESKIEFLAELRGMVRMLLFEEKLGNFINKIRKGFDF